MLSLGFRATSTRVLLRAPRESDAHALATLLRANEKHLAPWTPAPVENRKAHSLVAVASTIAAHRRQFRAGTSYKMVLVAREEENALIGRVSLNNVVRGAFLNASLGYWIGTTYEGRGLVSEACRLALDVAFGTLGLHRVEAGVVPRNARSRRVLARLGFREEGLAQRYLLLGGVWEDHVIHALTREEWPAVSAAEPSR